MSGQKPESEKNAGELTAYELAQVSGGAAPVSVVAPIKIGGNILPPGPSLPIAGIIEAP